MAQDVSEEEDRAILDQRKAPWPGAQLVLGGSMSLNGSRLLGALVDFSVAKSAPFFLGSAAWLLGLEGSAEGLFGSFWGCSEGIPVGFRLTFSV